MDGQQAQGQLLPQTGKSAMIMGILGLALAFFFGIGLIFGIIALVSAGKTKALIDAGRMDPSGRGFAKAAKIMGIISIPLGALGLIYAVGVILAFVVRI